MDFRIQDNASPSRYNVALRRCYQDLCHTADCSLPPLSHQVSIGDIGYSIIRRVSDILSLRLLLQA